jgi:adenylate cyclase
MDAGDYAAAGLYDPESPQAADRLALLDHLAGRGATLEQMTEAQESGTLTWLGASLALQSPDGVTLQVLAERAHTPIDLVLRAQRAIGLPPREGPTYREEALASFSAAAAMFGVESTLQFSRVLGSSITRIIDAALSLFVTQVQVPLRESGGSELQLAEDTENAVGMLLSLPKALEVLFPTYIQDAIRRVGLVGDSPLGQVRLAVGFVDLVGSTRLARRLPGDRWAQVIGAFETTAYDLTSSCGGRVVKFIGDEAMFVAPEAGAACAIGLGLCDMAANHPDLQGAHGAIDIGSVTPQDGDYYGPLVNRASRVGALAGPGQLLTTGDLVQAVGQEEDAGSFRFQSVGERVLRGFDEALEIFSVARR